MTFSLRAACGAIAVAFGVLAHAAEPPGEPRKPSPTRKSEPAARPPAKAPAAARPAPVMPDPVDSSSALPLFEALIAEFALQRGNPDLASSAYADLALRTRDPKVLERTVEVAGFARRLDLALEAARLWVDVEPDSKRAQQVLASVLLLSNRLDELAPQLERMLAADKTTLPENLLGLNRLLARSPDRQAVFRLIDRVCQPYFGIAEAHYAVAMAAGGAGLAERALREIDKAIELRPDWEMAALLKAQILLRDRQGEAIDFMQAFLERNPDARDLRLMLARAQVGEKRYADARRNFDRLLKEFPDSPDVVYPVAILALQQGDRALAEAQFKHYVTLKVPDRSAAYFYLGQIAEEDKRPDEAIANYSLVGRGDRFLAAQLRRAHLLAEQGQLDLARQLLRDAGTANAEERVALTIAEAALLREAKQPEAAFDLLDQLLAKQPQQPDLLYESALLAERLGRIDVMETRLRKLIALRPDSAQGYNALGYSLADRGLRLAEARELIEKALALSPEDSYILDSMGWVLYRLGDLPGAVDYLQRSLARRDDPEVIAHLGEVLWGLGRRDEAQKLLREGLTRHPQNESLRDAVKKYSS